ncbi:MAG: hypothetical protein CMF50_08300 [Legionellales bacterium]|nr:hypothetical protein [Legionellales bacterium]|tara:strand:+ start:35697 stop:36740 length:1044 start_codon:yes stop_codon:yes gene_type:complete
MADFKTNPLTLLGDWLGTKAKNILEFIARAPKTAWKIFFNFNIMALIFVALMAAIILLGPVFGILGLSVVGFIGLTFGAFCLALLSPYILPLLFTAATAVVGALVGLASLVAFGLSAITTVISYIAADVLIPLAIRTTSRIYENALKPAGQWIAQKAGEFKSWVSRSWDAIEIKPALERAANWTNDNILKPMGIGLKLIGFSAGLALTSPLWLPVIIGLEIGKAIGRKLYFSKREGHFGRVDEDTEMTATTYSQGSSTTYSDDGTGPGGYHTMDNPSAYSPTTSPSRSRSSSNSSVYSGTASPRSSAGTGFGLWGDSYDEFGGLEETYEQAPSDTAVRPWYQRLFSR